MFPRISALLAVAIAVAASARMERRMHARRGDTPNQCNTGTIKCCDSVSNVGFQRLPTTPPSHLRPRKASDVAHMLEEFSYSYDPADSVGINCTPFNIYGAGEAASCQQQPVCCSNNTYVSLRPCRPPLHLKPFCRNLEGRLRFQFWVFSDGLQLGIVLHEFARAV